MKSRRLTVVCMAAIALIGTPRAWQEISSLLSAAQQKAQLKFWSMVMRPDEPAEVELIAVAEEVNPAHGVSPCSEERNWTRGNFEAVSYRQVRRAAGPAASRPKASARRQRSEARTLIAHARKAPAGKDSVERRIREKKEKKDFDFDFSEVAENLPAPKPAPRARPIAVDTLTFAQLPPVAPVAAAAFSEKEVVYQFKLLKKTLNDNKLLPRQRGGRLPAVRVTTSFPAS
ncbi:MAG TPA: hypothetical protein VN256_00415 [Pyrinomonadaceae bacterium]|nr:hypothetical protein [Pyrinomonadaceae bacterium]